MGQRDKNKAKRGGNRGGGSRFYAESGDDIERRNARLAEFDDRRAQRRAEAADEEEEGATNQMGEMSLGGEPQKEEEEVGERPMTRKEREKADKERKAAEYRRRHELGLTDEYKRDMAKLAEVRARREASESRAKMEEETSKALEEERKKAAAAARAMHEDDSDDDDKKKKKTKSSKKDKDMPKLDKIAIKKMKPSQMKEALKLRGLEIQGNAKALTQRLLDYENAR